ncbi:MAG: PAS domain S-box protein [Anaerolineae bacterium]
MQDTDKTKEQLINELQALRRQVSTLQAAKTTWDALVQHSPDIYLVVDRAYRIQSINHTHSGRAPEQVLGANVLDFIACEDRELVRDHIDRAFQTGQLHSMEHRVVSGEDDTAWYASQAMPLMESGKVQAVLVSTHSIMGRKHAEAELAQMARFPTQNPFPVFRVADDGEIVAANPASAALLAQWQVTPRGKAPPFIQRQVREALSSGVTSTLEERVGETIFALNVAPVAGERYANVYGVDISDRVRAEEALRVVERQQRAILENLIEGIWAIDGEGRTTYVNPRMAEMMGCDRNDMLGRPLFDWMETSAVPSARARLARRATGIRERLEFTFRRKDGSALLAELSTGPLYDHQGRYAGAIAAVQDIGERRRAEEERERLMAEVESRREALAEMAAALQAERDRLATIMENTYANLAYLDRDLNFIAVNSAYAANSGFPPEDLLGHNHFDLFPDSENEAIFRQVRDTGQAVRFKAKPFVFAHAPERGVTYWDWALVPVLDAAGHVSGLVFSLLDVTERVRAQEQVARRGDRLAGLVELDRVILAAGSLQEICEATLDQLQTLVPCDRAAVLLFDQPAGTMEVVAANAPKGTSMGAGWVGPLIGSFLLEDMREGRSRVVSDLQDYDKPHATLDILKAEGIRAYAYAPLLEHGKLMGTLTIGRRTPGSLTSEHQDIIRDLASSLAVGLHQMGLRDELQRHADRLEELVGRRTAALQASEARFRAVFEASALGIAILDRNYRISQANRALVALWDEGGESLIGASLWQLLGSEDTEEALGHQALAKELLDGRRNAYQIELRLQQPHDCHRVVNLTVSRLARGNHAGEHAVVIFEDITERKQAEGALMQAERLSIIARLSSSLLHEINNPLQAVVGCVGLAREALNEAGDPAPYLEVAAEQLARTTRIMGRLHSLEHMPKAGTVRPTAVDALLEQSIALTLRERKERGIQVVMDIPESLPLTSLAVDAMQTVFLNLLLNAIDAMPQGGTLRVAAERTMAPAGVRIAISDTGPGIDPEALESIFEPFSGTKTRGLGLGLFISQDIVRRHGGVIRASSTLGQGATFVVWLPT